MLALLIAFFCICYLVYLGYTLYNFNSVPSSDVERRNLINSNPSYQNVA